MSESDLSNLQILCQTMAARGVEVAPDVVIGYIVIKYGANQVENYIANWKTAILQSSRQHMFATQLEMLKKDAAKEMMQSGIDWRRKKNTL